VFLFERFFSFIISHDEKKEHLLFHDLAKFIYSRSCVVTKYNDLTFFYNRLTMSIFINVEQQQEKEKKTALAVN